MEGALGGGMCIGHVGSRGLGSADPGAGRRKGSSGGSLDCVRTGLPAADLWDPHTAWIVPPSPPAAKGGVHCSGPARFWDRAAVLCMSTYVRTDGPGRLLTAPGRALLAPGSAGLGARTRDMPAPGVPRAHCPHTCLCPSRPLPTWTWPVQALPGPPEPGCPLRDVTTGSNGDRDEGRALRRQEVKGRPGDRAPRRVTLPRRTAGRGRAASPSWSTGRRP